MINKVRTRQNLAISLAAVLIAGFAGFAAACPIPVFQFSLEYWNSDPYQLVVHHDGGFTAEQQEAVDILQASESGQDGRKANITISWRDYSRATIPPPDGAELPRMVLSYPRESGIPVTVWAGRMDKENVENMLDSPARQQIADKLLNRHAAVWVLLESGNRRADRNVRRLLERELERLENTLKVPDPEKYGIDLGDIYTDINFSLVTLSRNDQREQMLIKMLLGIERDLDEYEDKPIVFPIYGRGIALYALIGDGINSRTLNGAGRFLTGPCSCQVKAGNPGVDLLMSVDWKAKVEQLTTYVMPETPDAGGFLDRMDEAKERLE